MQAEVALLHGALGPDAVRQVALTRVDFVGRNLRLFPIESSSKVRTSRFSVTTANAPVVVNNHNAIIFLPCGFNRTCGNAGRVLTLLALHGHVEQAAVTAFPADPSGLFQHAVAPLASEPQQRKSLLSLPIHFVAQVCLHSPWSVPMRLLHGLRQCSTSPCQYPPS